MANPEQHAVEEGRSSTHRLLRGSLVVTLLLVGAALAGSKPADASGPQICSSGNICVSWVNSGAIYYGYAVLQDYSYFNDYFDDGTRSIAVANATGYGRNRNSIFTLACYWKSTNYTGGSGGSAPYNGATWVLISQSTESHNSTTSSLC
ncbi:MAG TPA: hypothetical protein PK020_17895 [Ilumatobacteraceae bacterium]|nr:hypothetical protein [Ilumatobacteraceae bacterium]HRB03221.1 hypothetical protein [Ilumatobacteraceae bacterium]